MRCIPNRQLRPRPANAWSLRSNSRSSFLMRFLSCRVACGLRALPQARPARRCNWRAICPAPPGTRYAGGTRRSCRLRPSPPPRSWFYRGDKRAGAPSSPGDGVALDRNPQGNVCERNGFCYQLWASYIQRSIFVARNQVYCDWSAWGLARHLCVLRQLGIVVMLLPRRHQHGRSAHAGKTLGFRDATPILRRDRRRTDNPSRRCSTANNAVSTTWFVFLSLLVSRNCSSSVPGSDNRRHAGFGNIQRR